MPFKGILGMGEGEGVEALRVIDRSKNRLAFPPLHVSLTNVENELKFAAGDVSIPYCFYFANENGIRAFLLSE